MALNVTSHHEQLSRADRVKAVLALALTFSAGFVDITGMLTIYKVFTAHMTGDTVHLAQHLQQGTWTEAAVMAVVLFAFIGGSVLGRAIIEVGSRKRFNRVAAITLSLETVLILSVIWIGPYASERNSSHFYPAYVALAMLAGAMGLQTATLTRVGPLTVHTTFVTGMLNKFSQLASHAIFRTYDLLRDSTPKLRANRRNTVRQASFIFSIWLLYLTGAVCGTWLAGRWGVDAFFIPVGVLSAVIAVAMIKPVAIAEEREQMER